ncbi:UPF0187-domain-containing protein [Hortaea werneckii]|nr:UPF0187-domain-containing protein [Hortaea werneckii]KAI7588029.1 UPF0187-domain-containing protein [Hortaea werneckii]
MMESMLQTKVQQLGDLDLAILVSLTAGQHCMFSSDPPWTRDLRNELRLSLDDFSEMLLVDDVENFEDAPEWRGDPIDLRGLSPSRGHSPGRHGKLGNTLDDRRIANVVIAHQFDRANSSVQTQTLELLRTKRIFTRTSMHVAPKSFIFMVVLSKPEARLGHHLNDMFAMSHFHTKEDGFPHLEGFANSSVNSVFPAEEVKQLRTMAEQVRLTGEIAEYLHNIVVFARINRYIKGGITAAATRHLRALAMALAPLHGISYVTPSLVALACRKVYPHRLILATAETERSLQWGSDPQALKNVLQVVYLDGIKEGHLGIPSSVIPSLSIVVGLMLVFRNQTSYDRFWQGNQHLTSIETCIRNLTRSFLTCSYSTKGAPPTEDERAETEEIVRILLALIFAAKHHLRAEWGSHEIPILMPPSEVERRRRESQSMAKPEYSELLPPGTRGFESQGLGLLLQLSIKVEAYIKRGHDRGWFHAPQASQLTVQLNTLVAAYGNMETIHLTPLPVAYLIHMRQVLAIFGAVLPFALVEDMGWWTILLTAFICFTLYGIEAIGAQLEDPFGYDRNDIKVEAIVEDLKVEMTVLLSEWRRGSDMFNHRSLI